MFNGSHVVIYSSDADADRVFFKEVLNFPCIDAGEGWLIFAMPAAEAAFHPHATSRAHEFYLMCDSIEETQQTLLNAGVVCSEPEDEGWGILSSFLLPGGSTIGFYQPRHERPGVEGVLKDI